MTQYRTIQSQFTSGLLSPLQEGTVGTSAYAYGLSIAENVFYGLSGGVFKRNGTRFGAIALADSVVYSFSYEGDIFAIEFGNLTARLLDSDGKVIGTPVTTQYPSSVLSELCCSSFMDKLYITHRNYPPATISVSNGQLQPPSDIQFVQSQNPSKTEGSDYTVCKTFSEAGDYPALNVFYGGRWYLHSTANEPLTIWASRTLDSTTGEYRINDFTLHMYSWTPDGSGGGNWDEQLLADLAFSYLSSNMYGTSPRWMTVHQCLLIGAARSIFKDGGNSAVTATTDSLFTLSVAMEYGTRLNQAVAIGSYVFFVGSDGCTLMCAAYDQQYSSYTSVEVSMSVSRYLRKGIKRLAAISTPMPLVWVLTNDGILLSCLFSSSMVAWSVMTFADDDYPEWIEELQGGNDGETKLLLLMKRGTQRTIETLSIVSPVNLWEEPCLDCYTVDEAFPLQSRNVAALDVVVRDGIHKYIEKDESSITEGAVRYRGLKYSSVIGNLRAELPANGTSQSTKRSVASVVLRLYKSRGGEVASRPDLENSEALFVKDMALDATVLLYDRWGDKKFGEENALFGGEMAVFHKTSNTLDDRLVIRSQDPFPFCITALIVNYMTSEV